MSVTVKIVGSVEKSYTCESFPTDKELERLHFSRGYVTVRTFEERLKNLPLRSRENKIEGEIVFHAIIKEKGPVIRLRRD